MTAVAALRRLEAIAYFDIRVLFDRRGRLRPVNRLSAKTRGCIASYQVTRTRDGEQTITVTLVDKLKALEALARL